MIIYLLFTIVFISPPNTQRLKRFLPIRSRCLYAFGNENEHKIVIYWDIPNGVDNYNQHVAKCLQEWNLTENQYLLKNP